MKFAVYLPSQSEKSSVPVIYWLSGLTCTEANFSEKAGAQKYAAEHGVILVIPDTSPRGLNIPGENDSYDFGSGAGFYVDATCKPWKKNYRMYSYITKELPALINQEFPTLPNKQSIMGHRYKSNLLQKYFLNSFKIIFLFSGLAWEDMAL